jgi:hypothetical protein
MKSANSLKPLLSILNCDNNFSALDVPYAKQGTGIF